MSKYPSEIKSVKGLRKAYQRMYMQSGGLPRAISILKSSNKEFMAHLDRMARIEPKESTTEQNINIRLDVPSSKQLEDRKVINLNKNSYTVDTTPTDYIDTVIDSPIDSIDNSLDEDDSQAQ